MVEKSIEPRRESYRGWRSTKLHLALITMGLLTVAYAVSNDRAATFDAYALWLVSAAGIYSTASAAEKFAK